MKVVTSIRNWYHRTTNKVANALMSPLGRVLMVGGIVVFSLKADHSDTSAAYGKIYNTIVVPWLIDTIPWIEPLIS